MAGQMSLDYVQIPGEAGSLFNIGFLSPSFRCNGLSLLLLLFVFSLRGSGREVDVLDPYGSEEALS